MKITSQEEYALRCVLQLARRGAGVPVAVSEIGKAEGLSTNYANKMLLRLRQAGIVRSVRGVKGGYLLLRSPGQTSVGEVIQAVSGPLFSASHCASRFRGLSHECLHNAGCGLRPVWQEVVAQVDAVLSRMMLTDVLEPEHRVRSVVAQRLLQISAPRPPGSAPAQVPA